ncbi:MAG: hypothetical protein Q7K42_03330 [Candidatus Diapherotrites archaeon]|nr:hypothetical protein [Candidatus Diapherotrites archaeon]
MVNELSLRQAIDIVFEKYMCLYAGDEQRDNKFRSKYRGVLPSAREQINSLLLSRGAINKNDEEKHVVDFLFELGLLSAKQQKEYNWFRSLSKEIQAIKGVLHSLPPSTDKSELRNVLQEIYDVRKKNPKSLKLLQLFKKAKNVHMSLVSRQNLGAAFSKSRGKERDLLGKYLSADRRRQMRK